MARFARRGRAKALYQLVSDTGRSVDISNVKPLQKELHEMDVVHVYAYVQSYDARRGMPGRPAKRAIK